METAVQSPLPDNPAPARSWLFVPGANERFMRSARQSRAAAIILDLEDGIAPSELTAARERIKKAIDAPVGDGEPPLWVRTNAVTSSHFDADIAAAQGPALTGIILPKVESAAEVLRAAQATDHSVRIGVMIEGAAGLERISEILASSARIDAVIFGAEDFSADLGLPPTASEARQAILNHARQRIIIAAASHAVVHRVDSPTLDLNDTHLAAQAARQARETGFTGKLALHPRQIVGIEQGFRPTETEIAWAEKVLSQAQAGGALRVDGKMVDEAVLRQARTVLREVR